MYIKFCKSSIPGQSKILYNYSWEPFKLQAYDRRRLLSKKKKTKLEKTMLRAQAAGEMIKLGTSTALMSSSTGCHLRGTI